MFQQIQLPGNARADPTVHVGLKNATKGPLIVPGDVTRDGGGICLGPRRGAIRVGRGAAGGLALLRGLRRLRWGRFVGIHHRIRGAHVTGRDDGGRQRRRSYGHIGLRVGLWCAPSHADGLRVGRDREGIVRGQVRQIVLHLLTGG